MAFQWFKNSLGMDRAVADLSTLITEANEVTQAHLLEQKKGLRRLSLAQRQQGDTLDALKAQVEVLSTHFESTEGALLHNEHLLELLDNLHRIALAGQNTEMVATLVQKTVEGVLRHCRWQALTHPGQPYPDENCEVIGAVPAAEQTPGTVKEVIQQGYLDTTHRLIRAAKVVVYQQPQPRET